MRRARRFVVAAAALALLMVAVVHLPFSTALVLEWMTGWLRRSAGIELSSSALRYNLFTLSVELRDVRVASTATPDDPFASANRVEADLGWRTLMGRFDLRRLEIDSPSFTVRREQDGSGNLPDSGSEPTSPTAPAFTLPDVSVEDLAVEVTLPGLAVSLQNASATVTSPSTGVIDLDLRATAGVSLTTGETTITADAAAARARYDGRAISIDEFSATRPGTSVTATGSVDIAGDDPQITIDFAGSTDLASWTAEAVEADRISGRVEGRGQLTGARSSPAVIAELTGENLGWSTLEAASASANGTFRDGVLEVDTLTGRLAGGSVDGRARIAFAADSEPSTAIVSWSGVDLSEIAGGTGLKAGVLASGRAAVEWQWPGGPAATVRARLDADARLTSGDQAVNLTANASGTGADWRVDVESADGDETVLRAGVNLTLDDRAWTDSAISGAASLAAPDIQRVLRILDAAGIPLGALDISSASGSAALAVTLDGTLEALTVAGNLEGRSVVLAGSPPAHATATFALATGDGTSTGQFQLDLPDLAPWAGAVFPELGLRGGLTATGGWSGPLDDPTAIVDLAGRELVASGIEITSLSANGSASVAAVDILRAELHDAGGGVLTFEGRYDLVTRHLSITASGSGLQATFPAAPGTLTDAMTLSDASMSATVEGLVEDLSGEAAVSVRSVRAGTQDLGTVDIDATFANGTAALRLRVPALGTTAQANVDLTAPYTFTGSGTLDSTELARVARAAGLSLEDPADLAGSVDGSIDFSGQLGDGSALSATVALTPADVVLFGVPIQAQDGLRLIVADGRIGIDRLALLVGDVSIDATGEVGTGAAAEGSLQLDVNGRLESLGPWLARLDRPSPWATDGRIAGRLEAVRTASGLHVTGTVESAIASVRHGDESIADDLALAFELDGTRVHLRQLTGSLLSGQTDITGSAPLAWLNEWLPASVHLASPAVDEPGVVDGTFTFDVAAALARADVPLQQEVGGIVSVTARLSATALTLEAATGDITIDRGEMTTLNRTFAQAQPTVLRLAGRQLIVETLDWRGQSGDIAGGGAIGLAADVDTNLSFVFDTTLRVLDAFVPGRSTGTIRGTLDVGGHPGNWSVATEVTLADASWLLPEARLFFADWSGQMQVTDEGVVVSALEGQLNGGTITVTGRLPFGTGPEGDGLTIVAREVLLDIPKGLHSQAVADLRWIPRDGASVLAGSVTLTANRYREPVTRMLEMVDTLSRSSRGSASEDSALPDWLASTTLDIALSVTDPVILDNSLGTVEFVPDLRLTGTVGSPALAGDIGVLDDGRISIGGRRYRLRESRLRFVPAEGLAPTLDVVGETRVGDYDVVLRISGRPDQIETSFSSSPPLSERDLRSLLVTGQVESAGTSSDEFALEAASTDILGLAGKFVGLDSVRLGAADLDIVSKDARTAQHLTVSKSFGRMFELILSENLEDGPLTWVVVWKPLTGYEFRFASVENTETTVEFRQELLFGPGASRARSARPDTPATPQPQIAGIEITGNPGFSEAELSSALRLKPGQRFDIRRWIDDRVRLERFYRDRDYHRVRIVPTRIEGDSVGSPRRLSLRYDIDRGPRTVIEVAGDDLPADAVKEMQEEWGGVPIADILRDEFERIARLALARRGYFRATVGAEFTTLTDELEQAVLTVDRGARTRHQLIAWSGNRAVTAADLDAIAAELPAELSPFVDPPALVRDITARYAEAGFFDTEVVVGATAFDGDTATLPIAIVEGPVSRVTSLALEGVAPDRLDGARAAVDLPDGSTFGSRTAIEAHRRLEGFYADLGYRDAAVTYSVDRSPEGSVALAMTVDEGLPHVVSDVQVSGVESTSRTLVDRAVTLAPGQEAGRQRALDTRRNLYDIGTFRQVDVTFEPSALAAEPGATIPVWASVSVEEPRKYQLRYGVQISSNYTVATGFGKTAFGATAELRDRNFLGRGMQASVGARYDTDIQAFSVLLSMPRTFGREIRTNIFARERREITDADVLTLEDRRRDFTFEQRWRPRQTFEMAWSYAFGYRAFRLSAPGDLEDETGGFLAGPTVSVVLDHRDDPFDATSGWFHSSSIQGGLEWLGSDLDYSRYLGRQTHYVSFGPLTFAGGGRWGTLDAYRGAPPLSVLDLFFTAGGTNTIRGYPEGSLSAATIDVLRFGDLLLILPEPLKVGGPELLVLNGEVRYPVFRWIRGVIFVDAGNTFLSWNDISASKMAVGGGLGIRIRTPLAPLRFDFAYPLTTGFGYRGLRIHFSIGQMF